MDEVLNKLQEMAKLKDKEIEEYLEEFAEEKVQASMEIKMKYNKMMNMLKGKPDQEEKLKGLEEKKRQEEAEMQQEMNENKALKTQEIKDKFNKSAQDVRISFDIVRDAMRVWGQLRPTETNKVVKEFKPQEQEEYGLDAMTSQYKSQHRESTGYIGRPTNNPE